MEQDVSPSQRPHLSTEISGGFVEKAHAVDLLQQVKLLQQLAAEPVEGGSVDAYRERCAAIAERLSSLATRLAGADRALVDTVATNMVAAASDVADVAQQSPLPSDTKTVSASSRTRGRKSQLAIPQTPITSQEVLEALRHGRIPADVGKPCSHSFGHAQDDYMRLVAATALGLAETDICGLWSPPLRQKQPFYLFYLLTGEGIKCFRGEIKRELIADLQALLMKKIIEIARDEATQLSLKGSSTFTSEVGKSFERVALKSHDHEDLKVLSHAFGIDSGVSEKFVSFVLYRTKATMFDLIENGPLVHIVGSNKVQLAKDYVLGDLTMRALGAQVGLTRERIRQVVEEVAVCSPLVRGVIESQDPVDWPVERQMALGQEALGPEMQAKLVEEVRRDPAAAYARAVSLDPNPLQLVREKLEDYHERIFLVAFTGSYVSGYSSRRYPLPLRDFVGGGSDLFRELVFSCADQKIRKLINDFKLKIPIEQIARLLSEKTSLPPSQYAPVVLKFVEGLVQQPSKPRDSIWRTVSGVLPMSHCDEIFSVVEPLVRCAGERRAEQACSVFEEPWVRAWLRNERLIALLDARLRRQLSVRSAARDLGLTVGTLAGVWAQLQRSFPSIAELVPRMAVRSRSGL